MKTATSASGAATRMAASSAITRLSIGGHGVLDAVHRIQSTQASDLACRWNCKAGNAAPVPRKSTAARSCA